MICKAASFLLPGRTTLISIKKRRSIEKIQQPPRALFNHTTFSPLKTGATVPLGYATVGTCTHAVDDIRINERGQHTNLVADSGNETVELRVTGELGDVLDQPPDHLGVALPEGRHEAGHLTVVLAVNIRACVIKNTHYLT